MEAAIANALEKRGSAKVILSGGEQDRSITQTVLDSIPAVGWSARSFNHGLGQEAQIPDPETIEALRTAPPGAPFTDCLDLRVYGTAQGLLVEASPKSHRPAHKGDVLLTVTSPAFNAKEDEGLLFLSMSPLGRLTGARVILVLVRRSASGAWAVADQFLAGMG